MKLGNDFCFTKIAPETFNVARKVKGFFINKAPFQNEKIVQSFINKAVIHA
jgi:hypothetical protein